MHRRNCQLFPQRQDFESHTYYQVFGGRIGDPLVVLHGGPGLVHDYLFPFVGLADEYEIPVILYDQLSAHSIAKTH